jgi:CRP-like cAMP-binding protein
VTAAQPPTGIPEGLRVLVQQGYSHDFPAGASLLSAGRRADAVYFLSTGLVKLVATNRAGKEFIVSFQPPGRILGMTSALLGVQLETSVVAVHSSTAVLITTPAFIRAVELDASVAGYIRALQAEDYRKCVAALCALSLCDATERVRLWLQSACFPNSNADQHRTAPPLLMHKDLAAALNITPTHLSRILRRLREQRPAQHS